VIKQYLKIIRLHIIIGGILAFAVGALLGVANGGVFNPVNFAVCYATVFFGDLSTHFSNDYFDVKQDKGEQKKPLFSHHNVLTGNPAMLPSTRKIAVALLSASLLISIFAVAFKIAPLMLLLVAIGGNFLGWFYSAPPLRLVSKGLGETAIALAVGFAIPAAGYLSSKGTIDSGYGLFAVPFVLYGFMLALSLEAPDVACDCLGDKKTLGVTKGVKAVFNLAFIVTFAAFLMFLYFAMSTPDLPVNFYVVSAFSSIPLLAGLISLHQTRKGKDTQIFSAVNVLSLIIINMLIIGYLAVILSL
jgi:1,4-dihydroxy-2-naphthoate polyprenyltransferase